MSVAIRKGPFGRLPLREPPEKARPDAGVLPEKAGLEPVRTDSKLAGKKENAGEPRARRRRRLSGAGDGPPSEGRPL